jgi:hypothetical protein
MEKRKIILFCRKLVQFSSLRQLRNMSQRLTNYEHLKDFAMILCPVLRNQVSRNDSLSDFDSDQEARDETSCERKKRNHAYDP